ncbi:replication-associated recombination protein A [Reinekea marina]|uniref:Replication-associated recombination protein A n=1 Tax=Reinekea marina TaxID=1310421 RepID=A0ABV7WMI3_9GAMM|nr:replication-associated recombination protein A [Reinekea marina]MDN3649441.1 replication-associated recombination protein A [Reinekea marina]
MQDLFSEPTEGYRPLAEILRPSDISGYVGQEHILANGKPLRKALDQKNIHSMIFWGPPGVGKTTLARILSSAVDAHFETLSAVQAGVKDIKIAAEKAKQAKLRGDNSILFIDEIHRFNKSQQDALLPYVEDGTFIFVGATTENPSFELNSALLSRARVYVLKALSHENFIDLWQKAKAQDSRVNQLDLNDEALAQLIHYADGDARRFLNMIEIALDFFTEGQSVNATNIAELLQAQPRKFDKGGEQFYDQISAFHKSVRGSSTDGALYWLCRMLDGGIDPIYLARRMVRIASEDIGNADPRALTLALNAWDTQTRLGSPEGELTLAQCAIYLASAPKSNAVYKAFNEMNALIKSQPSFDVPLHLRNAPTALMKDLDYGTEYRYAHDEPDAYAAGETYLPSELGRLNLYQPVSRGLEIKIARKLEHLQKLDEDAASRKDSK